MSSSEPRLVRSRAFWTCGHPSLCTARLRDVLTAKIGNGMELQRTTAPAIVRPPPSMCAVGPMLSRKQRLRRRLASTRKVDQQSTFRRPTSRVVRLCQTWPRASRSRPGTVWSAWASWDRQRTMYMDTSPAACQDHLMHPPLRLRPVRRRSFRFTALSASCRGMITFQDPSFETKVRRAWAAPERCARPTLATY